MYLSISCWWSLKIFWYFGTIVIKEVEFGAAALTIKDHMFKLQIIRIMCPIREVKLPPLPKTYFHQVETLFSLRRPVFFPHLGFPRPTIRSTPAPQSSTPDLPTSSSKFVQFHLFSTLLNLIGPWCSVPSFWWNCPKSAINFRNAATCIWPAHSHSKIHSCEIRWQTSNQHLFSLNSICLFSLFLLIILVELKSDDLWWASNSP